MSNANSRIGVENLTFSKLLTDVSGSDATYDTPWSLGKKTIKISITNPTAFEKQHADDQTVDIYDTDQDIEIGIDVTDLTEDERADLLGQTMVNGVRTPAPSDVKPFWSVSFKSKKRNGNYKYYKSLKTKFKESDETLETKKDNAVPQTDQLMGTGIQRITDGLRKRIADEDATSYQAGVGSAWFSSGDIDPSDYTP